MSNLRGKVKKYLPFYQENPLEARKLFKHKSHRFRTSKGNRVLRFITDLSPKDRMQLVSILKGFSKVKRDYSMLLDKDISYVVRSF